MVYYAANSTGPQWGLTYGGHNYIIYYLHYDAEGVTAFCSPLLSIEDTDNKFIPLLLVMLLICEQEEKKVMELFKLTVPTSDGMGINESKAEEVNPAAASVSNVGKVRHFQNGNSGSCHTSGRHRG